MRYKVAFLFAALASPGAAQPPTPSPLDQITRAEARALPPGELAERTFRLVATHMQAVTRPIGGPNNDDRLFDLVFATAPRSAGDHGQCLATAVHIGQLRAPDDSLLNDGVIATEVVYKVIGDVEAGGDWTEAYSARQEQLCAQAGPVILADAGNEAQAAFFHFSGARLPTIPLIALQRAIRAARAGTYADVACDPIALEEAARACRDPKALLAGMELARLTDLEISRPGLRAAQYQVEATFRLPSREVWRVTLDMDFSVAQGQRVFVLGHSEIARIPVDLIDAAARAPPPSE